MGIAFPARHERGSSKVRVGSEGSTGGAAAGGARRGAMATEVARCEVAGGWRERFAVRVECRERG